MRLPIHYLGHSVLREKAKSVEEITPEILRLIDDMIETMISHNGVGLAAPQVGRLLRIFIRRDEIPLPDGSFRFGSPEVLINPTISEPSQETIILYEGCLSIPGVYGAVERPKKIRIRYQNVKGERIDEVRDDFLARVTMHENDHLNGVLHIDRFSSREKKRVEQKLRDLKKKLSQAFPDFIEIL